MSLDRVPHQALIPTSVLSGSEVGAGGSVSTNSGFHRGSESIQEPGRLGAI